MGTIMLTNGMVTQVDDEDQEKYGHLKWRLLNGRYPYRQEGRRGEIRGVLLHRLIAGAGKGDHVHHRNGDKLDNRRANLEVLSPSDHHRHHERHAGPKRGGYKGVCWDTRKRKWLAQIDRGQGTKFIGYFDTEERAALVYDKAAYEVWGDEAYFNFPERVHEDLPPSPIRFRNKYRGPSYNKQMRLWLVWHQSKGRKVYLGSFRTAEEAAVAYDRANHAVFGEQAELNFPCMIWSYRKNKLPLVRRRSPSGREKNLDIPLFADPSMATTETS